jgi:hypothetical protein
MIAIVDPRQAHAVMPGEGHASVVAVLVPEVRKNFLPVAMIA